MAYRGVPFPSAEIAERGTDAASARRASRVQGAVANSAAAPGIGRAPQAGFERGTLRSPPLSPPRFSPRPAEVGGSARAAGTGGTFCRSSSEAVGSGAEATKTPFEPPLVLATGESPGTLVLGDFDGDRDLDLANARGTVTLLLCPEGPSSVVRISPRGRDQQRQPQATSTATGRSTSWWSTPTRATCRSRRARTT